MVYIIAYVTCCTGRPYDNFLFYSSYQKAWTRRKWLASSIQTFVKLSKTIKSMVNLSTL